jgi:hypothetical protein
LSIEHPTAEFGVRLKPDVHHGATTIRHFDLSIFATRGKPLWRRRYNGVFTRLKTFNLKRSFCIGNRFGFLRPIDRHLHAGQRFTVRPACLIPPLANDFAADRTAGFGFS